jgi:SsrA-binding protein
MSEKKDTKININNREITHKYEIIERIECGIELKGTEVKSIRDSKCNLRDSFAIINGSEVILKNMHISPYEMGNINNVPEKRDRKLLLHKLEIIKMIGYIKQGGYTLVPSKIYTKGRWFKVELCICKGKKIYDKRDVIKQNEAKRQINEFKRMKVS